VGGVPHAVFPAYFTEGGPCIDPWLPGHGKNKCLMVYQYSTPTNLSDPYLANWTQPRSFVWPTQGVQPHDVTFEDPSAAWEDPSTPGRWIFIGQTNDQTGVLLEGWASKNGSDWSQGFSSLGNFFPTTGDSRCSIKTGCGYFTPSFGNGAAIRGYHVLWGGNNQYWLGRYRSDPPTNASRLTGSQVFVPATVPQPFDGPESSCAKGFWDARTGRYLLWFWVAPAGDGKYVVPEWGWDSMVSIPRHLDVDTELMQITLYPVKELEVLRVLPPVHHQTGLQLAEGVTPLAGVQSNTLDLELTFDWSHTKTKSIPTTPNLQVGVAVLLGAEEQTLVTLTLGAATRFNNGTRKNAAAVLLGVDTRRSRSDRGGGAVTPKAVTLKDHEALTLRVLVDRSVIDAFAMGGRGAMTRRM
jgi:beta-fructofuranosidase